MADDPPALTEPAHLSEDWHLPLNDNFADIEAGFNWLYDQVAVLDGETDTLRTDVDANDSDISDLDSRVTTLEDETYEMDVHGNDYHDPNFALESHDHDSEYAPIEHGNAYHNHNYVTESWIDDEYLDGRLEYTSETLFVDAPIEMLPDVSASAYESVATQAWVESERSSALSAYVHEDDLSDATVDHASTAGTADGATLWEGYELVFDDETPQTDQYIRFET